MSNWVLSEAELQALYTSLCRLKDDTPLNDGEAREIIFVLASTLNNEDAQIEWDDAYDALRLFGLRHEKTLPYLEEIISGQDANGTRRNSYSIEWAKKAIKKIQVSRKNSFWQRLKSIIQKPK